MNDVTLSSFVLDTKLSCYGRRYVCTLVMWSYPCTLEKKITHAQRQGTTSQTSCSLGPVKIGEELRHQALTIGSVWTTSKTRQ